MKPASTVSLVSACALCAVCGAAPVATATDAATGPAANTFAPEAVSSVTLDNGMKIFVWPDHDIPHVAFYNFVRVGSRNEVTGATGLAHFFEHMMFNGTSRRAPGEFDRQMEARGGANNASTSSDLTIYSDWFPRSALGLVLDLEADRLANLAFVPKVVESERSVVYSERRFRVEDNNEGLLAEQVQATAFIAHPYQIPTLGWPSDIQKWRIEDLQRFFRTYYAPNNCTVVITGDVTAPEAFRLARRYLGPLKREPAPPVVRTQEPEQLGERRVVVERRAQTPLLQIAYKAPAATDPHAAAVDLLAAVLTNGDASILHRRLVEERKIAVDVGSYWSEGIDPGLFWIMLTLPADASPARAEAALDEEIARLLHDGVTDEQLQRAKNLTAAGFWRTLSTMDGRASLLGQYETLYGDWHRLFEAPQRTEGVTREELLGVAREILKPQHRTVGVLLPKTETAEEGSKAPPAAAAKGS
jgi:zinc protease